MSVPLIRAIKHKVVENSVAPSGALHSLYHVRKMFRFPLGTGARKNLVGLKKRTAEYDCNLALGIPAVLGTVPCFSSKVGHMCVRAVQSCTISMECIPAAGFPES